jgi:phosphoribosylformylglycinamidine synthase subunit PurL
MVQVGDPFTEKLLLEASLELIRSGHIVGIQDMGAAGLVSSSTEMAARRHRRGHRDHPRARARAGMTPYEILLSETQERMLVVAKEGREEDVRAILGRWELDAETIGRVTDTGMYVIRENGEVVVEIPGEPLVDACPTYTREGRESAGDRRAARVDAGELSRAEEERTRLDAAALLDAPTIASKRWVYEQYDSTVRTNTVVGPGSDAAVLRLRGTRKAIAATVDCNGRYVYLNPRRGGQIAVAEAARNLVCSGALPRAVTDNLNFGNPLKPEVYHQLSEAVRGIGEACRVLETPVTGGNVSLYNENPRGAIYPTPTIGMVGVIDDLDHVTTLGFARRATRSSCSAQHGRAGRERVPEGDPRPGGRRRAGDRPGARARAAAALLAAIRAGCPLGARRRRRAAWRSRSRSRDRRRRSGRSASRSSWTTICRSRRCSSARRSAAHDVPARRIGTVGAPGGVFRIETRSGTIEAAAGELMEIYESAIPRRMDGTPADIETALESEVTRP